jgi:hypothetical protein
MRSLRLALTASLATSPRPRSADYRATKAATTLVRRHSPLVELHRLDVEHAGPFGLVAEDVLKRVTGILLA